MWQVLAFTAILSSVAAHTLHFKPHDQGGNTVCPGKTTCPSGTTCCLTPKGHPACCPFDKATCCPDGIHCCPEGQVCDLSAGRCSPASGNEPSTKWAEKFPAPPMTSDVVCPGGQESCPKGSTCCKLQGGLYGCCPLPEATCCSDGAHCCPKDYTCDTAAGTCTQGVSTFTWKELPLAKATPVEVSSVMCPDGQSECPDGSTCCQLVSGQYGCCPMPNAVCCTDHLHCCPSGSKCDVPHAACLRSDGLTVPWMSKEPARGAQNPPVLAEDLAVRDDVKCPDGVSSCAQGTTCCKMLSGYYGCCPIADAVCCSDHLHCCAPTQTCDVTRGICKDGDQEVPWGTKFPAQRVPDVSEPSSDGGATVLCPDKQGTCPEGSTCCKLTSGKYGCCPLPKATCCPDHVHCCPNGYTCDVRAGSCNPSSGVGQVLSWSEKFPASPVGDIRCPGGQYTCPDGSTCCKMSPEQYGCCPMPKATCCDDGMHCCPQGYKCDSKSSSCTKDDNTLHMTAIATSPATPADVTCLDKSTCPDGTTCCKLSTGKYGCCPFPKAVCCADKLHCCPTGYTCDTAHSTCKAGQLSIPWSSKLPANQGLAEEGVKEGVVTCPDKKSQCQDKYTCCKLSTGQYGCCPLDKAVCCSDGLHCCPHGTTCNVKAGSCESQTNSLTISWDTIIPKPSHAPNLKAAVVKCQDGSECPDGSTCCALESGKYGCCPMASATCCADKIHCCPSGYKCDTTGGKCTKDGSSLEMSWWSHARNQAKTPAHLTT